MMYESEKQSGQTTRRGAKTKLPPTDTVRWFAGRKAQVVAAVRAGALSVADACQRYDLSPEELREWQRHYEAGEFAKPRFMTRLH